VRHAHQGRVPGRHSCGAYCRSRGSG
jgi:hypothetical protein